jgi:ankyrin repeat protein
MKALFLAIRAGDLHKVTQLLQKDPDLLRCTARQPPKKDDGQSPLQVAFKCGQFDIVDHLIDQRADVNFMEKKSVNEWTAPVIHDAIRAAIFQSRFLGAGNKILHTKAQFERAFGCLRKLTEAGADVKAVDSYGNNCLDRAVLDANQLTITDKTPEVIEDVGQVFALLIASGAVIGQPTRTRESKADSKVARFLK